MQSASAPTSISDLPFTSIASPLALVSQRCFMIHNYHPDFIVCLRAQSSCCIIYICVEYLMSCIVHGTVTKKLLLFLGPLCSTCSLHPFCYYSITFPSPVCSTVGIRPYRVFSNGFFCSVITGSLHSAIIIENFMAWKLISFWYWIIFYCLNTLWFIYLFTSWWPSLLSPRLQTKTLL